MATRKWDLLAGNVTEAHPSPVSVRGEPVSSTLRGRSRLTEARIGQSLEALNSVVVSSTNDTIDQTIMTTPTSTFRSKRRLDESDTSTTGPQPPPAPGMISLMDESGLISDYPTAITQPTNITMLNLTNYTTDPIEKRPASSVALGITRTTNEDPLAIAVSDLLRSFHGSLSDHISSGEILNLLSELHMLCTVRIHELKEKSKNNCYSDKISELTMERDTWTLIEALYTDRLAEEDKEDMDVDDALDHSYSDKMVIDKYFEESRDVREGQMVVDWLERICANSLEEFPLKAKYFADTVSWENTIHDIQQGINKDTIVTEIDPDAPTRQNRKLSELDESDQLSLCKNLFKYIRAGKLDKAKELCVQCGQSWRAATLNGWKLFHDPNMDKDVGDDLEPIEGNCGRGLWKSSCWEMANCTMYNKHERALYAALCGNLNQLLPACQSWYDYVWAYYHVMVDILVEQKLLSRSAKDPNGDEEDYSRLPEEYWRAPLIPDLIFQEIESYSGVQHESANMYHQIQKFLILGDLESLVDCLYLWREKHFKSPHHLRFMAHIILFVKTVGVNYDESKCNRIVGSFVEVLISNTYPDLVALYTSYLPPEQQVQLYSFFLSGIHDTEQQKNSLKLAVEAGLDVALVTKAVVENTRIKIMESQPPPTDAFGDGTEMQLSSEDMEKIKVLNWLLYYEDQRAEAVHQANAMMRMYLGVRRHNAACAVFDTIPNDSPAVIQKQWISKEGRNTPLSVDIQNDLSEYLSIKAYLEAIESFNRWFAVYHNRKTSRPLAPSSDDNINLVVEYEHKLKLFEESEEQWKIQSTQLAQVAEGKITNVLLFVRGGWMVDNNGKSDDIDDKDENGRRKQMILLRQLCIPYLCILLHTLHHNNRDYNKCLQLADIIASEEHKLYKEFRPAELHQFLGLLNSSAMELLNAADVDEFGYKVTTTTEYS